MLLWSERAPLAVMPANISAASPDEDFDEVCCECHTVVDLSSLHVCKCRDDAARPALLASFGLALFPERMFTPASEPTPPRVEHTTVYEPH